MKKSHAVARVSEEPTFGQLRELIGQAESGRLGKEELQTFLNRPAYTHEPPEKGNSWEIMREVESMLRTCSRFFPGREWKLITKLLPLLSNDSMPELKEPQVEKLQTFRKAIFWREYPEIIFASQSQLTCDFPAPSALVIECFDSFGEECRAFDEAMDHDDDTSTFFYSLFAGGIGPWDEKKDDDYHANWKMSDSLRKIPFAWVRKVAFEAPTIVGLLDKNLQWSIELAGTALTHKKLSAFVSPALEMLDVWQTGNFPVGFNSDGDLVVLCA